MAVLNFPSNPTLNQVYSFNGKTWIYNGQGWALDKAGAINGVVIGNIAPAAGSFTALTANTLNVSSVISAAGNIVGNTIIGNIQAADGDGAVQFNVNGIIGAAAGFNYDRANGSLFATAFRGAGDPVSGTGAIYGGVAGYVQLGSTVLAQFTGNTASYAQTNLQNINTGNLASADYVITSDNGTDTTYYLDLGLAGSNHADPNFFGDTSSKNDAYLYVTAQDQAGPFTDTGNLIIGSTNGVIKLFVGNTAQANVIATVSSGGVDIAGDVSIDGNLTVTGNATLSGNILGDRIQNGNTSIDIQTMNGNANVSVGGVSNVAVFTPNGLDINGNVTAGYFFGNVIGNISGNLVVPGANTEVIYNNNGAAGASAAFTFDQASNVLSVSGNVVATGFTGSGAGLTSTMSDKGSDPNNWNTLLEMGAYAVNRVNWGGVTGPPLDSQVYVGLLTVSSSNSVPGIQAVQQVFAPGTQVNMNNIKVQWVRNYWSGSWTPWVKMVNDIQQIDGGSF